MLKRLLVYTITVFFSLQYMVGAVPIFIQSAPPIEKDIFIPESYGVIEKSSFDKYLSSRLVILLKDAHCNYDAQHNIARILEVLVRDYKVDLVAVEGAVGFLDYARLEKLENETAREKMADSFVKKGILTGPEYLKITKDGRLLFNIYGIEDEKLYIENFIALRQTIDHLEETLAYINELDRVVKNLKKRIYPEGLLEFDNKSVQYYENTISLTDWVKGLKLSADKSGMILKEYPNILITLDSIELEEKIDFKKVELERAESIGALEKILPQEELKEMVSKSLQFRLGKISSGDYYKYLEGILGPDANEKYPNFTRYIQLVKFQSWINNDALFSEIERLEDTIKETMFENNVQRQLNDISKRTRILNGLFKLTLTREDIGYYRAHRAEFLPSNMLSFISIQAPLHNIPVSMLLNDKGFLDKVSNVILDGEKFYDIAIQRDVNLVENTLRVMEEKQKSSAVMVIGGFHTDGVVNLFEEKGVGYVVISPKIVMAEKEGLYISLMMDKRIAFTQRTSSLAFPKLLAEGDNVKLLIDMGALGWSAEQFDIARHLYNKFRGEAEGVKVPEAPPLPFRISVGEGGIVTVERNSGYTDREIPDQMLEWFRMGLEEVLKANPDLRDFITEEDNLEKYLDRTALVEYRFRTRHARQEGILRRTTLGFITFYLGVCRAYAERGLLSLPEDIRERFLPGSIRRLESGEGIKPPEFKSQLLSELKREGIVDEGVAEAIANYLFSMPAYGYDAERREYYQTLFFNSYLGLIRDVFKVEKDSILDELLTRLQAYRYLQVYLGRAFGVPAEPILEVDDYRDVLRQDNGKKVELMARYILSNGAGFEGLERVIEPVMNRKLGLPGWRGTNWGIEAGALSGRNEDSAPDPLKRDLYVAVLSKTKTITEGGEVDPLSVSDSYRKELGRFEGGLPRLTDIQQRFEKKRVFVRDVSTIINRIELTTDGRYYQYSDLSMPGEWLSGEIGKSPNAEERFIYTRPEEKAILMAKRPELKEEQFIFIEDYERSVSGLIGEGNIVVTMLGNELSKDSRIVRIEGNRMLVGNEEGSDHMFMSRLALAIAEPEDLEKERAGVQNTIELLLIKYYNGAIGADEIKKLVEDMTTDIFRITLPPITPFVKEYYNTLMQAREVIAKAA